MAKKTAPVKGRSLATFRAEHDPRVVISNKIRKALEQLAKDGGPEAYAYEFSDKAGHLTFAQLAGVGSQHLARHREEFKDFIVEVKQEIGSRRSPRHVWFATAKAAKAARGS